MISNIQFSAQKPVTAKQIQKEIAFSSLSKTTQPSPASGGLNQLAALNKANLFSGVKQPTFSGLLDEDYGVEIRTEQQPSPGLTSAALRSLLLRDWAKQERGDTTQTLKFFIDDYFGKVGRTALADTLRLVNRPVDVIARSNMNVDSLLLMQQATGKRFLQADCSISTSSSGAWLGGRSSQLQIRREFQNSLERDVEYAFVKRTGVKRSDLFWNEFSRGKERNSLEALAFGKQGLADAVIVGYDQVVTRESLDTYLEENGLNDDAKAKKEFLSDIANLEKIPTTSIAEFSPESVPPKSSDNYLDEKFIYRTPQEHIELKEAKEKEATDFAANLEKELAELKESGTLEPELATIKKERTEAFEKTKKEAEASKLTIYTDKNSPSSSVKADAIATLGNVENSDVKADHRIYQNIKGKPSYLQDDTIFFNDGFEYWSAGQITKGLRDLDRKKRTQDNPSNIKLIEYSPGGYVTAAYDIRNTIKGLKTDVDVIVTGYAASCGALLLASATGNKLATPMSQVMIHEPSGGTYGHDMVKTNQGADSLHAMDVEFSKMIESVSGRDYKDVLIDMDKDVWLSPLEAMFYGDKGLLDAILVGEDKVITKADVTKYLVKHYGSKAKLEEAVKERIESLREGRMEWTPEDHDENDPFENPLKTIEKVAARYKKNISSVKSLAGSVSRKDQVVDHIVIAPPPGIV